MFFVGDSAGHCLPLTAEGIRTALYFGLACGRELRAVLEGRRTREQALQRYGAFSAAHARKFAWMLRAQQAAGRIDAEPLAHRRHPLLREPPAVRLGVRPATSAIAPPAFVADGAARADALAPGRRVGRSPASSLRQTRRAGPAAGGSPPTAPGVISRKHMSTRSRSIARSNSSRPRP